MDEYFMKSSYQRLLLHTFLSAMTSPGQLLPNNMGALSVSLLCLHLSLSVILHAHMFSSFWANQKAFHRPLSSATLSALQFSALAVKPRNLWCFPSCILALIILWSRAIHRCTIHFTLMSRWSIQLQIKRWLDLFILASIRCRFSVHNEKNETTDLHDPFIPGEDASLINYLTA